MPGSHSKPKPRHGSGPSRSYVNRVHPPGRAGDDSDDEPLKPKIDSPPTNGELKKVIQKILKGANLEEVTMKTVCKQVYEKFPAHDLTERKDFIKSTVKDIINQ